jgi:hypothetical protein
MTGFHLVPDLKPRRLQNLFWLNIKLKTDNTVQDYSSEKTLLGFLLRRNKWPHDWPLEIFKEVITMKFEPTAKSHLLRELATVWTSNYRASLNDALDDWDAGYAVGILNACSLIGITDEDIERTKELARRIVDYENEKELQLHK